MSSAAARGSVVGMTLLVLSACSRSSNSGELQPLVDSAISPPDGIDGGRMVDASRHDGGVMTPPANPQLDATTIRDQSLDVPSDRQSDVRVEIPPDARVNDVKGEAETSALPADARLDGPLATGAICSAPPVCGRGIFPRSELPGLDRDYDCDCRLRDGDRDYVARCDALEEECYCYRDGELRYHAYHGGDGFACGAEGGANHTARTAWDECFCRD